MVAAAPAAACSSLHASASNAQSFAPRHARQTNAQAIATTGPPTFSATETPPPRFSTVAGACITIAGGGGTLIRRGAADLDLVSLVVLGERSSNGGGGGTLDRPSRDFSLGKTDSASHAGGGGTSVGADVPSLSASMAKYLSISAGPCFFKSQADGNRAAVAPAIAMMRKRRDILVGRGWRAAGGVV